MNLEDDASEQLDDDERFLLEDLDADGNLNFAALAPLNNESSSSISTTTAATMTTARTTMASSTSSPSTTATLPSSTITATSSTKLPTTTPRPTTTRPTTPRTSTPRPTTTPQPTTTTTIPITSTIRTVQEVHSGGVSLPEHGYVSYTTAFLSVGGMMSLIITALVICCIVLLVIRHKTKEDGKRKIQARREALDIAQKRSEIRLPIGEPSPYVVTSEAKAKQLIKAKSAGPQPVETRPKDIAGVLNFLARNPADDDDTEYRAVYHNVLLIPQQMDDRNKRAEEIHKRSDEMNSVPGTVFVPSLPQVARNGGVQTRLHPEIE